VPAAAAQREARGPARRDLLGRPLIRLSVRVHPASLSLARLQCAGILLASESLFSLSVVAFGCVPFVYFAGVDVAVCCFGYFCVIRLFRADVCCLACLFHCPCPTQCVLLLRAPC
jgi:hypothetical protein